MAETLPLFPLSTVLLPGASLPLHIFEPRYRQLTVDLVTETLPDRCFGVAAIRQLCPPDTVVISADELPARGWFPVTPIPLDPPWTRAVSPVVSRPS